MSEFNSGLEFRILTILLLSWSIIYSYWSTNNIEKFVLFPDKTLIFFPRGTSFWIGAVKSLHSSAMLSEKLF